MDVKEARVAKNNQRHPWERARLFIVKDLIDRYCKSNGEEFFIMDIGCGDLYISDELSKVYPESSILSVDTGYSNDEMVTLQNKYKGSNIRLFNDLNDIHLNSSEKISIVLLLDVIEHIEDDRKFLLTLINRDFIGIQTLFFLTAPAFQSLFSAHDHFLHHYRRYTVDSLTNLAESTGMVVDEMGYFFSFLLFARIIQFIKEKLLKDKIILKKDTALSHWSANEYITNSIKEILIIDYRISRFIKKTLGFSLIGLSAYIICHRSV
jgi:hypothetical protein